jgi:predicted AAA+ superfamily ATPase
MFAREVKLLKSKSFFLFGARGTGKSTLLKEFFKDDKTYWIDLLDESLLQRYLAYPLEFEQTILGLKDYKNTWIVVDEVQKAPALLNYVHRLIEQHKIKFALTGSSARKLKRGGANLLAGRATSNSLHPLTHLELGLSFDLDYALNWGSLPQTFSEDEEGRKDFLRSYATTYVKEEIKEEQVVRKIEPFLHFLEVAAQCNGNVLNFSKIGRDSGNPQVMLSAIMKSSKTLYLDLNFNLIMNLFVSDKVKEVNSIFLI